MRSPVILDADFGQRLNELFKFREPQLVQIKCKRQLPLNKLRQPRQTDALMLVHKNVEDCLFDFFTLILLNL